MTRALIAGTLWLLCGCAAQVRGLQVQKPFAVAPAGIQVSLVSVQVPREDLQVLVKAALAKAFQASSFMLVDETAAGKRSRHSRRSAPRARR